MAKICARFIEHIFNCQLDSNQPYKFISEFTSQLTLTNCFLYTVPISEKPTVSTIPLPEFIAYIFHRTRLPPSLAYNTLFLLEMSCRFLHLRPSFLLNQPHALFEGHL